jgi:hypothetical protein
VAVDRDLDMASTNEIMTRGSDVDKLASDAWKSDRRARV